jgi:hypothetical protein
MASTRFSRIAAQRQSSHVVRAVASMSMKRGLP